MNVYTAGVIDPDVIYFNSYDVMRKEIVWFTTDAMKLWKAEN